MMIEALIHLHVRRANGDIHLRPGVPVELPDEEATRLLQKVPGKVRAVQSASEPAMKPDGSPLTPVYWERGDGSISGPASVEFFSRMGSSDGLVVRFQGELLWISARMLRSERQWASQKPVVEVDRGLLRA